MSLIGPHGGSLVSRQPNDAERQRLIGISPELPSHVLSPREAADFELISIGALSPLEGFMGEADYISVRDHRHLANGTLWPLPVTLSLTSDERRQLVEGSDVALRYSDGELAGILHLEEIFEYDKELEAERVYLTRDAVHPGVAVVYRQGEYLAGGRITVLASDDRDEFAPYRYSPRELRSEFEQRGWKRVVAFQTRNPVHRAHEYIQKCALETVDGLLLHPLVGETKADDIPAPLRVRAYEVILEHYYPKDRTLLAVLPAAMRYAGPREAIFHAIIRQNYGCSHFIVGRDHAGVGSYYGTYDAQRIFTEIEPGELAITPMFFDNTFFCRKCDGMASSKTCPHDSNEHVSLSGTRVREMLSRGDAPPLEFTRHEVAQVLMAGLSEPATTAA
jgi:sulfate adenylyltransferase